MLFRSIIHADFGSDFSHQENFRNLPELSNLLKDNLITKSIDESDDNAKKINFIPWVIILILLLSLFHLMCTNLKYALLLQPESQLLP